MTNETNAALSALRAIRGEHDLWQCLNEPMVQIVDEAIALLEASQREAPVAEGVVDLIAEEILDYAKQDQADGSGELFEMMSGDLKLHVGDEDGLTILIDSHRLALSKQIARRLADRPSVTKVNRPGSNSTTSDWDDGGMKIWNHGVLILHLDKDECQKLLSQLPAPSVTNVSRECIGLLTEISMLDDGGAEWTTNDIKALANRAARLVDKLPAPAPDKAANEGWISVKDRLPEESGHSYLTCSTTGHIAVRWLGKIGWDSDLMSSDKITHWQPLPEAPK